MAIQSGGPAPYAPTAAVLSFIDSFRNRNLGSIINADIMARIGITDSLIPRTLKSVEQLGLINEDGSPTPTLLGLRTATQEEFPARLRAIVEETYAEVLRFVDLSTDDPSRVADQFRVFEPIGMRPRMVSLFFGLAEAAGMVASQPRRASAPNGPRATTTTRKRAPRNEPSRSTARPASVSTNARIRTDAGAGTGHLPPAVVGMLGSLPSEGEAWTTSRYDAFMTAFGSILKFCYPIDDNPPQTPVDDDDDAE